MLTPSFSLSLLLDRDWNWLYCFWPTATTLIIWTSSWVTLALSLTPWAKELVAQGRKLRHAGVQKVVFLTLRFEGIPPVLNIGHLTRVSALACSRSFERRQPLVLHSAPICSSQGPVSWYVWQCMSLSNSTSIIISIANVFIYLMTKICGIFFF